MPMQELRLVAVSEDGSYAVLAVPGRGGRFSLPIDDRLRTVARGQFSRLAQYEIEVESPLRPKEIQDRIRAGETADEIADVAGVPIERVRRFEGPVLAEREYRAQEAQRATVRGQGDSGPGPRLGDVVAERLAEAGGSADEVQWDSRKRSDGNWQVQLIFTMGGRPQIAEWVFDPQRRHATPADDQAVRLCLPEADWPAAQLTASRPASATVTPIGSRLGQAGGHHAEPHGEPARLGARGAPAHGAPAHGAHPAAAASSAVPASGAAAAASHPSARSAASVSAGPTTAAVPTVVQPGVAPGVAPASAGPSASVSASPAGEADGGPAADAPEDSAERARRPARRAAGGRSRRASVPSWDEIMFGNSRQPD
jgi:Protein of unknown function (DUF3071)